MSRFCCSIRRLIAACVLTALFGSTVVAAGAADADTESTSPTELASNGLALEEFLDGVGLGAAWRSATALGARARAMTVRLDDAAEATLLALIVTIGELTDTSERRTETTDLVLDAAEAIVRAIEREQNATISRNVARHELSVVDALLRIVAVDMFEVAYDGTDEMFALDSATITQALRTREITTSTVEVMIARKIAAEEELARREQALVDAIVDREDREAEHAALVERQSELAMLRVGLDDDSRSLLAAAADAWVLAEVEGARHLTPRALDTYFRAEQIATLAHPRCRISWTTIAAISAVEGRHGTHSDAVLGIDGTSTPLIVGIALDGEAVDGYGNPVANIADTDGGVHDGDTELDRAVGPMQFIPQEWERWQADGDGDEEMNPHDLDDATVAAAGYLCNYGSHRSWENWNTAVHAYNHSNAYVASVKGNLDRLARLPVPDIDDGLEWQPRRPAGAYVEPPPEPEPELEGDGTIGDTAPTP